MILRAIAGLALAAALLAGPAAHADRHSIDERFRDGMAAAGAQRRDEAIRIFHDILVERPDLVRVRLELARLFFLEEEDALAREHFEQALAGDVPEAVARNIQRFLHTMRQRRRWTANFGVSLAPSSNISAQSRNRTIEIYGLDFQRAGKVESGTGLSVWTGGEYQFRLAPELRLRTGGTLWRREYGGSRFDRMVALGHAGPRWILDPKSEMSALATVQRDWSGGGPSGLHPGVRLEFRHVLTPQTLLEARTDYSRQRFRLQPFRNGPLFSVSLDAVRRLAPTLRLNGGVSWDRKRTDRLQQRTIGRRIALGASLDLPAGFTAGARATMGWTRFKGNWWPFTDRGQPRKDRTRSLQLSLHNRGFTVLGFSPRLSVRRELRESNSPTDAYGSNVMDLTFVRQL